MSKEKFLKLLDKRYSKFNEVNNKSFPLLMKDFIGKDLKLLSWYEIIKVLLLGSEENINVAGSLFISSNIPLPVTILCKIFSKNLIFGGWSLSFTHKSQIFAYHNPYIIKSIESFLFLF